MLLIGLLGAALRLRLDTHWRADTHAHTYTLTHVEGTFPFGRKSGESSGEPKL